MTRVRAVLTLLAAATSCRAVEAVLPALIATPEAPEPPGPPDPPAMPPLPPLPPPAPAGPLSGLIVVLSPGHGRHVQRADTPTQRPLTWDWQRDARNGLREDEWTAALCAEELGPALAALGATVVPLRSPDRHAVSVVADDADAAFEAGAGARRGADATLLVAAPDAEAWARWTLTAPSDGAWHLAARWPDDPTLDTSAHFVIETAAGTRRVDVDQSRHGGAWWPLADLPLAPGDHVTVTLRTDGTAVADAVRLGGGAQAPFVPELGPLPAAPFFELAAVHQLAFLGGPDTLLHLDDGRWISDMRFRARWTSWLAAPGDEAVFLSLHTNAGGGRGTMLFYGVDTDTDPVTPARAEDVRLADAVHTMLSARLPAQVPGWRVGAPRPGNYSEISPWWNEVPALLVEAAFHTRADEARQLRDPAFRAALVQGVTEGVVAWRSGRPAP